MGSLIFILAIGILLFFVIKSFFNKEKAEKSPDGEMDLVGEKSASPWLVLTPIKAFVLRLGLFPVLTVFWSLVISFCGNVLLGISSSGIYDAVYFGLGAIVSLVFLLAEDEPKNIPANCVGIMTFLDKRINILLSEGKYSWYARRFFFGISTERIEAPSNSPFFKYEALGLVFVANKILTVWNENDSEKKTTIRCLSKTGTDVFLKFSIGIRVMFPLRYTFFNDPILEICNRARTSVREAVKNFLDVDVNGLKSGISSLLEGKTVLVAFTLSNIKKGDAGSVVKDTGGSPMVVVVDDDANIETAKKAFEAELIKSGDQDFLHVTKNENGSLNIKELKLSENIGSLAEELGCVLYMNTMSDIDLSAGVKDSLTDAAKERGQEIKERLTSESVTRNAEAFKRLGVDPNTALANAMAVSEQGKVIAVNNLSNGSSRSSRRRGGEDSGLAGAIIASSVLNQNKDEDTK